VPVFMQAKVLTQEQLFQAHLCGVNPFKLWEQGNISTIVI